MRQPQAKSKEAALPGAGPATLADVARRAGVSPTTASFVLNERPVAIPAETRERVYAAARELRYAKSAIVTALQQGRSHTLGVHFNSARGMFPSDPVMGRALAGISDAAQAKNYHTLLYTGMPAGRPVQVEAFLDRRADGIILVAPPVDSALVADVASTHLPCAVLFSRHVPEDLAYVNADNAQGAYLAVEHLVSLGHRRIAHLAGASASSNFRDRRHGYEAAVAAMGIPFDPALVVTVDISGENAAALRSLLALPDPPSAIFCYHDGSAVGVLRAAAAMGVAVPEALSVVGFDDCILATTVSPPLTTIRQPLQEMGRIAASALVDLIEGVPAAERRITVPVELVVRGTTAPVRR